jgi:predicted nucleic acid-binding protein
MKVVLDSNILIADFNLQTPNFMVLFESSRNKRIDLFIPQVVLDEVINKYEQQISKMYSEISTQIRKYNKVTLNSFENPILPNSIYTAVSEYSEKIKNIFEENAITVLPYPDVDHAVLARKAMLSKKPFNSNEKGYRDNLIWENISPNRTILEPFYK